MSCEYCLSYPHRPGCPNFEPLKARATCAICNDGIAIGEEYIINPYTEDVAHWDCIDSKNDLVSWLNIKVEEMDEI